MVIELVDQVANVGRNSKVLENSNDDHINLSSMTWKSILCKSSLREKIKYGLLYVMNCGVSKFLSS